MTKKLDLDEVREFISATTPETKIYIGADSERYKRFGRWYADYTIAVIVHYDGCRGCRVFGESVVELDHDQKKERPSLRLMTEVMKCAEMYLALEESIGDRYCELHLDINSDPMHASNIVVEQAVGYIIGTTGKTPKIKPDAFSATFAADRLKEIMYFRDHPHLVNFGASGNEGSAKAHPKSKQFKTRQKKQIKKGVT